MQGSEAATAEEASSQSRHAVVAVAPCRPSSLRRIGGKRGDEDTTEAYTRDADGSESGILTPALAPCGCVLSSSPPVVLAGAGGGASQWQGNPASYAAGRNLLDEEGHFHSDGGGHLASSGSTIEMNIRDPSDVPAEDEDDLEEFNEAEQAANATAGTMDDDACLESGDMATRRNAFSVSMYPRGGEAELTQRPATNGNGSMSVGGRGLVSDLPDQSSCSSPSASSGGGATECTGKTLRADSICERGTVPAPFQSCASGLSNTFEQDTQNTWSVQFRLGIFIEEYLAHLVGPFAHPYLVMKYSKAYADNHQLIKVFSIGFWAWLMFLTINLLMGLKGTSRSCTLTEMLIADLIFLSRNSIIAFKYGQRARTPRSRHTRGSTHTAMRRGSAGALLHTRGHSPDRLTG